MFLPYMGMAAILVMWPGTFEKLSFPDPMEDPHQILAVSQEKEFESMLNLSDLGPRSMNDFELWYSYRFMYSFS